jgi:hypothetical protein
MSFPISVKIPDGEYAASLVGAPDVQVVKRSRSQTIPALTEIRRRIERGEPISLEIEPLGVLSLAGRYSNDPTLGEICDRAYQIRDVDRRAPGSEVGIC